MTEQYEDYHMIPRMRADGSIDTAYYLQRSRELRSEQAFAMMPSRKKRAPRRPAVWIARLLRIPSRGSA